MTRSFLVPTLCVGTHFADAPRRVSQAKRPSLNVDKSLRGYGSKDGPPHEVVSPLAVFRQM